LAPSLLTGTVSTTISDPTKLTVPNLLFSYSREPETYLCHREVLHISQQDRFSCGYRNFQVLVGSLAHTHPGLFALVTKELADVGRIPTVRECQLGLERAWSKGYDPAGAKHYSGAIVDKREQVGTYEFNTLLRSIGVKSNVYRFIATPDSNERNVECATTSLLDYVRNYFVVEKETAPIFLQYIPHSVSIVGYKDSSNPSKRAILVFDSKESVDTLKRDPSRAVNLHGRRSIDHKDAYEVLRIEKGAQIEKELVETSKDTTVML
jgi:hypothetical protein